ncbi:MAG: hypothetical protein IJX64_04045 [Clostridia bacterium]|nr:hypothetical protein [Clostridia bacterium]
MYICNRCGYVTDEVSVVGWKHTELDGSFYEYEDADCACGGEFAEACECDRCGEYEAEGALVNGWCRACVDELCAELGLDRKRDVAEIYDIIEGGLYE